MRNLLLLWIPLFVFNACGTTKEEETKQAKLTQELHEAQEQKNVLTAKLQTKEKTLLKLKKELTSLQVKLHKEAQEKQEALLREKACKKKEEKRIAAQQIQNQKLSPIGIEIQENKITIDANKSKDFFQTLNKNLEKKVIQLTQKFKKGIIDEKEAGIHIDDTHININLNKTKGFLETWGKQLQGIVKQFGNITKEIEQLHPTQIKGN